jgi:hypothetical protein
MPLVIFSPDDFVHEGIFSPPPTACSTRTAAYKLVGATRMNVLRLTIRPNSIWRVWYTDCIIGVRPLHLRVQIRLQVRRAIVALKGPFRITESSGHVHRLRPTDLEAVPLCALALVEEIERRVLESHI